MDRGPDGYFHPSSEAELSELVRAAGAARKQLRVRGATHSVAGAIFTDAGPGAESYELMLERYDRLLSLEPDPEHPGCALVEVEAGIHLGKDPHDPTGTSSWERSLNAQLMQKGYALADLGGITHQTVAGFLSTGSSGGSLMHGLDDDIVSIRVIGADGVPHDIPRDDPLFGAYAISMGLLGVISRVTLRVWPAYYIFGKQTTAPTDAIFVDLFDEDASKIPLRRFWEETPYSRMMWWPQKGVERVQLWQAARTEPWPNLEPQPYSELDPDAPRLASLAGSLVYTVLGNLDDVSVLDAKLEDWWAELRASLGGDPEPNACPAPKGCGYGVQVQPKEVFDWIRRRLRHARAEQRHASPPPAPEGPLAEWLAGLEAKLDFVPPDVNEVDDWLAAAFVWLLERVADGFDDTALAQWLADRLKAALPELMPSILTLFVEDGVQHFWDTWMCGLPMDNQMDDQLWPTHFTELWIPVEKTSAVMRTLRDHFRADGTDAGAYAATGAFTTEFYTAPRNDSWLSPSFGGPAMRVNVFRFGHDAGDPREHFQPYWDLLEPFGWRPHWGKWLPAASPRWTTHYREHLERFDEFLALRAEKDPEGIFLTSYWKAHLGIE